MVFSIGKKSKKKLKTMSNNNQSSVESLFEKLWDTPKDKFTWYAILEEHKAIHQQEMVDAILDNRNITSQVTFLDAVQYYTETFNK